MLDKDLSKILKSYYERLGYQIQNVKYARYNEVKLMLTKRNKRYLLKGINSLKKIIVYLNVTILVGIVIFLLTNVFSVKKEVEDYGEVGEIEGYLTVDSIGLINAQVRQGINKATLENGIGKFDNSEDEQSYNGNICLVSHSTEEKEESKMSVIQKNVKYPQKIKKSVSKGYSKSKFEMKYEYELIKAYSYCAIYQNTMVSNIREGLTLFDIKSNPNIEVLTDKELVESQYFEDIWEE